MLEMRTPKIDEIWWLKTTDGFVAARIESAPASGKVRVRTEEDCVLEVERVMLARYRLGHEGRKVPPPGVSAFKSACSGARRERVGAMKPSEDLFAKLPPGVREGLQAAIRQV